ncbi:MAG TPA: hypothetical protein VJ787_04060 [Thermoleophilia bacterium]|nr:hypothetical protein [Thermoleophilia bacterium]
MSILSVVIVLLVIGVLLYLVNKYIPMQPPFIEIINVAVIFAGVFGVVLWLLSGARLPRVR